MRRLGVVAETAGQGGTGGECERGVRLGGADEHVVEHSPVGEQFRSETIIVPPGARAYLASRNDPQGLFD